MGNDSVKRFDVFITYTHMRAADGSDDRGCATWLLTSMRERVNGFEINTQKTGQIFGRLIPP